MLIIHVDVKKNKKINDKESKLSRCKKYRLTIWLGGFLIANNIDVEYLQTLNRLMFA